MFHDDRDGGRRDRNSVESYSRRSNGWCHGILKRHLHWHLGFANETRCGYVCIGYNGYRIHTIMT
jgi:hypothetical protein